MKQIIRYIQQHLSIQLGIIIVAIVTAAFSLLFGLLFSRGKEYIQQAAIDRAMHLLDNTAERINGIMDETETVTNFLAQTTPRHLVPDSLLSFSRRAVKQYDFLTGMAISMEPNFFPEMGRYFSAYSLRHWETYDGDINDVPDSITTVREGPFEYFEAPWYKTPRKLGKACWVDAYDDYNEGTLSSPDILTSYCCPMRDANGRYLGSITASLTLKWLSKMVTSLPAYPNSSAIMIGRNGTYLVHPDTTKLFRETIFSDAVPESKEQIHALGKSMIAGHSGMIKTTVDDHDAFIFYRPLERTGWSIAIVCPTSDVFARYNHLLSIVWTITVIGLVLIMLFCIQTIRRAMMPIKLLDKQAQRIAEGQFDKPLPKSKRHDSVGRLTNSFISMQQSLEQSVDSIRQYNDELQQQNDNLTQAYELKMETNRQKVAFIQDMYHKIRTPLNVISGFSQLLTDDHEILPAEEIEDITSRMKEAADDLSRLARELGETVKNHQMQ